MIKREDIDAPWYFGGIASAAASCLTHPIDLIRIQIQAVLEKKTSSDVFNEIIQQRGKMGLYFGLKTSAQRQLTYSITRFGIYDTAKKHGFTDTFWHRVEVSSLSGLFSGFINTPMEKVNVHVRTDVVKPEHLRRNYKHTLDGLKRVYLEGGIRHMWSCGTPSAIRGMLMTMGQLCGYDQIKVMLLKFESNFVDNWRTFFLASLIAGGITSIIVTPIDVIKNIGMNAELGKFKGSIDVAKAIAMQHGFRGFFKGLFPSFLRVVPQTIATFLIYEELRLRFGTLLIK